MYSCSCTSGAEKEAAKRLQKACKRAAERLQKGCCCLWAAADVIRHLDVMEMHSKIVHKAIRMLESCTNPVGL